MAAKVQGKRGKTGETNNANRWRLAGAVALGGLAMHQSDRIKKEKERREKEIEDQAKKKVERTRREAERRAKAESRAGGRKSPGGSQGWAEDLSEAERQVRELEEEVRRFEEEMRKRRGGKGRKEAEEESALSKELGLETNPTRRQVAKARRAAAKLHHPDVQGGSAEKMSKINNILDRMEERARADSILSSLSARIYSGLTLNVDTSDACAQIRNDAMKGKKCPGGYSIPINKQCGKGGKGGKMRSPGETNNANRWRLAGAVALGGLAMHQSDRIKQEKERRKNEMKEWDDLQKASGETLNSARGLNRNKRRKDSVLGRSTMDSFDACAQIRDNGKRME
ncbi:hypothetical protein [Prochlorothrix hollandica]|uniref:hypothetical protein n=1 Tax=Prochlorothrix hollandica TaxID=1223 RepID=UPI00333F37AA